MKVAIYNKETEELDYYNLLICWTNSIIDTQFELIGSKHYDRIGLQMLLDDKYVIKKEDLVNLLVYIDNEYKKVVEVYEDYSDKKLKTGYRIKEQNYD